MTIDKRFYELLAHLWRGGKYGYYWTPDDGNGDKVTWWLTAADRTDVPKAWLNLDVYFAVNTANIRRSQHERARIDDVIAVNCFYCEFDCPTPESKAAAAAKIKAWKIPAACVVDSGGGYHVYIWLTAPMILDTPEKRQRAADLQWAFAQWAGGDTSVNDLARVLRIPGTYNHKSKYAPDFPLVTIVEWQPHQQHDLADIEPELQPYIDARASVKAHTHTPSSTVSLDDYSLWDVLFKSKNGAMYHRLRMGDLSDANGDHSKADQILCNGLAWVTGCDIPRMDSLFRQSGLYRDKWADRKEYRERTLNNAANSAQTVYTPPTIDQDAIDAANAAVGSNGAGSNGSQPHTNGANGASGAAPTAQPTSGGAHKAPNNPTSADYIKSLHRLGYYFRLNDLDNQVEVNSRPLDDVVGADIRTEMRDLGYKGQHIGAMEDAYLSHAGKNRYHPIKDYLKSLSWNGDDHIRLLSRYFEDKHGLVTYDNGSTERVFYVWLKRWLVGAVAKVFESSSVLKAQNAVLVLEGSQNLGKSTFASWLCSGIPEYFIEQSIDPDNKEHERRLAGKWIWEIGELGSTTRKADREALKKFLSQTTVTFRTPYAKKDITKPALASFIGTVNNEGGFLQDSTGTRRFMTVGLLQLNHGYVEDLGIDQVWAQAFDLYRRGESWRLLPEEVQMREELNGDYKVEDAYEGWVRRYFEIDMARADTKTPGWFTTTQEIVSELKKQGVTGDTHAITMRLPATMKELGVEKGRLYKRTGPHGYWGVKIKP
jgi:hypothetical protein